MGVKAPPSARMGGRFEPSARERARVLRSQPELFELLLDIPRQTRLHGERQERPVDRGVS